MPAPWAIQLILNANFFDLFQLTVTLLADTKDFDQNHKDYVDYMEKAEKTVGPLIY